jgi:hypothetical protein
LGFLPQGAEWWNLGFGLRLSPAIGDEHRNRSHFWVIPSPGGRDSRLLIGGMVAGILDIGAAAAKRHRE